MTKRVKLNDSLAGDKIKAAVDKLAGVVICLKQAAVEKIKDEGGADGES